MVMLGVVLDLSECDGELLRLPFSFKEVLVCNCVSLQEVLVLVAPAILIAAR